MPMPQKKASRLWLRLEPDQAARLKALTARRQATISALVRYAIDRLLEAEDAAADGNERSR
jgi:predicted DNA-binding protein